MKNLNFLISDELHQKLKGEAGAKGILLKKLLTEILKEHFK